MGGDGVGGGGEFFEDAEAAEFLVALFEEGLAGNGAEAVKVFDEGGFEVFGGGGGIEVGAAEGLGDDAVHGAGGEELVGGELEGVGGLGGVGAVFPEDGGTAFRRDDGVVGVFKDEDDVGDGDAEGAAGAAFADDDGDDGGLEGAHFAEVDGDGFGDVALLGADAGIGAGGVHEGDDGKAEFLSHAHQTEGLAIAFGVGHAEVAADVFLGFPAFLLAEQHDGLAVEPGGAADDGLVVAEEAVSMKFLEVGEDVVDIVEGVGAEGVAGELDLLPGGEVLVDGGLGGLEFFLDGADFGADVQILLGGEAAEVLELGFELAQGFLEFERKLGLFHGVKGSGGGRGWEGNCGLLNGDC